MVKAEQYEQARETLVYELAIELEKLVGNLTILNRNLEDTVALGAKTGTVAATWRTFHGILIANNNDVNTESNNAINAATDSNNQ
ncbi:hypothetical protein GQ42DRAFT_35721 [Ramicandelaber brevisporus]|nr:hypothetical protein GQ42DRAFT_50853 [Ramicandelaber brevisporus]KAI8868831.1 hypothetical protein GQ42DRAFT_35721 [Ramicandelaber brevisporus]